MDLVIAEKPDIAKAVSKVIPGTPSWKNGYIEQGNYCITWCYGHLLTLKDPEDYGDEYARENTPNEKLPIFFDNWGTKVADKGPALLKNGSKAPDKGKQVKTIGELLKKPASLLSRAILTMKASCWWKSCWNGIAIPAPLNVSILAH